MRLLTFSVWQAGTGGILTPPPSASETARGPTVPSWCWVLARAREVSSLPCRGGRAAGMGVEGGDARGLCWAEFIHYWVPEQAGQAQVGQASSPSMWGEGGGVENNRRPLDSGGEGFRPSDGIPASRSIGGRYIGRLCEAGRQRRRGVGGWWGWAACMRRRWSLPREAPSMGGSGSGRADTGERPTALGSLCMPNVGRYGGG